MTDSNSKSEPIFEDTIVAVSTPPGRGGIGIVRLSGPAARAIAEPLLKLRNSLASAQARFAEILDNTGETLDEASVIAHCRANLAHYKCPTSVDATDVLPRNPSGKILKRELRAPYWAEKGRSIN